MSGLIIARRGSIARPLAAPVAPAPAIRTSAFGRGSPVAKPGLAQSTDLMLLAMHAQGGTHSGPGDWTLLHTHVFPGSFSVWRLWAKYAASGDPASWTWTDSNAILNWGLIVVSGAHQTLANNLWAFTNAHNVGSNSINTPVINTVAPSLPIQFVCDATGNDSTWTWPANTTKLGQAQPGFTIPVAGGHDNAAQAVAGNTISRLIQGNTFANTIGAYTIAVAPA